MGTESNITEDGGNHTTTPESQFCVATRNGMIQKILLVTLNTPLSISAFLGNVLIISALRKVSSSSLNPSSKLLYGCLAFTDLCVGLITQPLFVTYILSPENSKRCFYLKIPFEITSTIFGGVSVLTLTAISVDRLLALLLGIRYRQVVSLRRVRTLLVIVWLGTVGCSMLWLYNSRITTAIIGITLLLCVLTASFCYSYIYLTLRYQQIRIQDNVHQDQVQGIPLNITRYRKTVSSALWVQLALLLCYIPFSIVVALRVITRVHTPAVDLAWDTTGTLLFANSSLNPILYCWKIREVRQGVKNTVRQFCCFSSESG